MNDSRIYGTKTVKYKEFGIGYDNSIYEINVRGKLKQIATFRNMALLPGDDFYYAKEKHNDSTLYKIDPSTGERTIFTEALPYVLDTCKYCTGAHIFNFFEYGDIMQLSDSTFIMQFAECPSDCANNRYLLYNHRIKKYAKIDRLDSLRQEAIKIDRANNHSEANYLWLDIAMKDLSKKYLYVRESMLMEGRIENQYVIDASANFITPAVKKYLYIVNYNYQDGEVVSVMVHTALDNGKKVFVPYKFTLPLERSFYRTFNDREILKQDLKQFGDYELSILKNFIFAKHNYAFDGEFYQAYFNIFEFYRDEQKRDSRTKNINALLTEADTKNLKGIEKALKKYN